MRMEPSAVCVNRCAAWTGPNLVEAIVLRTKGSRNFKARGESRLLETALASAARMQTNGR